MPSSLKTTDLIPDPKNARKRTPQSAHLIQESLKRYGTARSVVIDENNMLIAGHGTVEAAKALGIDKAKVIEADGNEIIAVRRTGWTDSEKVGANLADNRTSDLSEWDGEMLHNLAADHDVTPWFSEDDILELLGESPDSEDLADDQSDQLEDNFQILITFDTEVEQAAALDTLMNQGFQCRALNS